MKKTTLGAFLNKDEICSFKLKNSLKINQNQGKSTMDNQSQMKINQDDVKINQSQMKIKQRQVKVKHIRVAPMPLF